MSIIGTALSGVLGSVLSFFIIPSLAVIFSIFLVILNFRVIESFHRIEVSPQLMPQVNVTLFRVFAYVITLIIYSLFFWYGALWLSRSFGGP